MAMYCGPVNGHRLLKAIVPSTRLVRLLRPQFAVTNVSKYRRRGGGVGGEGEGLGDPPRVVEA